MTIESIASDAALLILAATGLVATLMAIVQDTHVRVRSSGPSAMPTGLTARAIPSN